jgi:hypothetical protein
MPQLGDDDPPKQPASAAQLAFAGLLLGAGTALVVSLTQGSKRKR